MHTVITTAATQYYNRPKDERFASPQALLDFSVARKGASKQIDYNLKDLQVVPSTAGHGAVQVQSPRGLADLTPWSHSQLCKMLGAPAAYLRSLPSQIAADALNHGIKASTPGSTARLLAQRKDSGVLLRAVTSEAYGRLYDADWLSPVVQDLCVRQGWTNPPTWDGQPAGSYASDRDSFVVLVNGGSIVNDPSIRNGDGKMFRGIMLRNSEVGAAAWLMEEVLYQYVCGNHNFWGAALGQTYRRRHVGESVLRDVLRELGTMIRRISNRPASTDETLIRSLIDLQVAETKDGVVDELRRMGATEQDAIDAYDRCEQKFAASPRSYWGIAQGLTSISQQSGFQDERLTLDQLAAKILAKGRVAVAA